MRTIVAILALAALSLALTDAQHWGVFKARFNRKYSAAEEPRRFAIFQANLKKAEELTKADGSAIYGVTKFSDLTAEEFIQRHTGLNATAHSEWLSTLPAFPYTTKQNNRGTDQSALVTKIKDQGSCGSCYAFSATAAAEACNGIKGNDLVDLSVQQLLDCCTGSGCNGGCNGGLEYDALEWAAKTDLATEASYPYKGAKGSTCKKQFTVGLEANTCTFYKIGKTESQMQAALEHSVETIALDANTLQMYVSGVIKSCSGTSLNHALLLVSDEAEGDSYKIKNSWGENWGEDGYFRMTKNKGCLGINKDYHSCVY